MSEALQQGATRDTARSTPRLRTGFFRQVRAKSKGLCWSVPRPWTRRSDCRAASGVGLKRHGDHPEIREGTTPYATRPFDASRTDPCKVCGRRNEVAAVRATTPSCIPYLLDQLASLRIRRG
jgi:hypothetical protein